MKNHDYKGSLEKAKAHPVVGKMHEKIYGGVDQAKDGAIDVAGTGATVAQSGV